MPTNKLPDFMAIYDTYQKLSNGAKAELKRVSSPDDLIEIPAFYHLLHGCKANSAIQRVVFCLPLISHQAQGMTLGKALAKAEKHVNEKRLFMVIRSEAPNDFIQLRRLLKMTGLTVDWPQAAKTLYYWNELAKRQLLEDFFFYQIRDKK